MGPEGTEERTIGSCLPSTRGTSAAYAPAAPRVPGSTAVTLGMDSMAEEIVIIHGDPWKTTDVQDAIAECAGRTWTFRKWQPSPALIQKSGTRSQYCGQKYDPTKYTLDPKGWTHDHCQICWWTLSDSEDEAINSGYTDGRGWICTECFNNFLKQN
jgi:hypothetical protein